MAKQLPLFATYSAGLKTGRDAWCYNFSRNELSRNVGSMLNAYGNALASFDPTGDTAKQRHAEAQEHVDYDPTKISWNRSLLAELSRGKQIHFEGRAVRVGAYRPFQKQYVYVSRDLNDMVYQIPRMFPEAGMENYGFYCLSGSSGHHFASLAVDVIPDLHLIETGQFFPRFTYEKLDASSNDNDPQGTFDLSADNAPGDTIVNGYRRIDNISDDALTRYREAFGTDVTKDDIFASIYALLHSEQYRSTYATDLKRQLPRIPLPDTAEDFREFVEAGERLLDLHIRYEEQPEYPLSEETALGADTDPDFYRVQKLRWAGNARTPDKSQIVVNSNVTLTGIPDEAHEYMLGSRSALDWILDRYLVKTDKASGIVNDPNAWGLEHGNPRYIVELIKKVTYVSVETVKIVKSLPRLTLKK